MQSMTQSVESIDTLIVSSLSSDPLNMQSSHENISSYAQEHMLMLKKIRDAFFDESNMQSTLEKLIAFRDFYEQDCLSDIVMLCIKQYLCPLYTELGVALMQDCPLLILRYTEMNAQQLTVLQDHVTFINAHNMYTSSTEMGGGHRFVVLRYGLPKVYLNPGVVLYACRKVIKENLSQEICERTTSNVILQRVLCSIQIRPECLSYAEELLHRDT